MKRRLIAMAWIVGLVSLLVPIESAAQEAWYLRVRGGWTNASFYDGKKLLGDHSRNGFNGGVAGDLILNENLGWSFEASYTQKGAEGTITMEAVEPGNPDVFEGTAKLDYLVLSTNLLVMLDITPKMEARFFVGPAFGILVNSKAVGTVGGSEVEEDIGGGLHDWELLANVGAAFTYYFEKWSAFIDFRTEFGLTDVDNSQAAPGLKTRASMLSLGVGIPIVIFDEDEDPYSY